MAGALRDEDSGICFRDVFGFCSTGSQISWLPSFSHPKSNFGQGGMGPSHFFSGASDPLCGTPYKLFTFTDQVSHAAVSESQSFTDGDQGIENDHNTKKLWDLWRDRAIGGAVSYAAKKSKSVAERTLIDMLSTMEDDSMDVLECDGSNRSKTLTSFAEMVKREIELLESCPG